MSDLSLATHAALEAGKLLREKFGQLAVVDEATHHDIKLQLDKLEASRKANQAAQATVNPAKPNIDYDDFARLDIRVGTIVEAEKVPKTKKLLKLKVDTGIDQRTVVSGIAEHYSPEQVIGQKVVLLANLAPRMLKGIESKGMILMAENAEGKLCFVSPSEAFGNGSEVR